MSDKILMPKELTAENGAKGLLSGEFYETITFTCPDCDGGDYQEVPSDRCGSCGDTGEINQNITISWDNIKRIYALAVKNLSQPPIEEDKQKHTDLVCMEESLNAWKK